jgi:hypothetical protein
MFARRARRCWLGKSDVRILTFLSLLLLGLAVAAGKKAAAGTEARDEMQQRIRASAVLIDSARKALEKGGLDGSSVLDFRRGDQTTGSFEERTGQG